MSTNCYSILEKLINRDLARLVIDYVLEYNFLGRDGMTIKLKQVQKRYWESIRISNQMMRPEYVRDYMRPVKNLFENTAEIETKIIYEKYKNEFKKGVTFCYMGGTPAVRKEIMVYKTYDVYKQIVKLVEKNKKFNLATKYLL